MRSGSKLKPIIILFLLTVNSLLVAQKNEIYGRFDFDLEYDLLPKIELEITPELRMAEFNKISELLLQTGLTYSPFKHLDISGYHRIAADYTNTETEYLNRFAFDIEPNYDIKRLELELRLRFTNFTDFEEQTEDKNSRFRYRLQAKYDIKKCKVNPHISTEFFQKTGQSSFYKGRYEIGAEYNFKKNNDLEFYYFMQDYYDRDKMHHIIGFKYQLNL